MPSHIICVTGPEGAGKDTLINTVRRDLPQLTLGRKFTTREERPDDIDPITNESKYQYALEVDFMSALQAGWIVEHERTANGHLYGSLINQSRTGVEIRDIGYVGALQLAGKAAQGRGFPRVTLVGVLPGCGKTIEEVLREATPVVTHPFDGVLSKSVFHYPIAEMQATLRERLELRGDSEEIIKLKLQRAVQEIPELIRYWQHLIINDDLAAAAQSLAHICMQAIEQDEVEYEAQLFQAYSGVED